MAAVADLADDALTGAVGRIVGTTVTGIFPAVTGGNSRIFRVETDRGCFALKLYPRFSGDSRDRVGTEARALAFFGYHAIRSVPVYYGSDRDGGWLVMEWIDGKPAAEIDDETIVDAADFLLRLHALSDCAGGARFGLASEACLSSAEIMRQIRERRARLDGEPALRAFFAERFDPLFDRLNAGGWIAGELARNHLRLIPADFGLHNALRRSTGELIYCDFEYFGWDDPVKATADFLLHPGMSLRPSQRRLFANRIIEGMALDDAFETRLRRRLPLFGLRWALIVLNPFLRERRGRLPGNAGERQRLLDRRLRTATRLCGQSERSIEEDSFAF